MKARRRSNRVPPRTADSCTAPAHARPRRRTRQWGWETPGGCAAKRERIRSARRLSRERQGRAARELLWGRRAAREAPTPRSPSRASVRAFSQVTRSPMIQIHAGHNHRDAQSAKLASGPEIFAYSAHGRASSHGNDCRRRGVDRPLHFLGCVPARGSRRRQLRAVYDAGSRLDCSTDRAAHTAACCATAGRPGDDGLAGHRGPDRSGGASTDVL